MIKKIIFAGTPEFAQVALQKLIDTPEYEIVCVLTQPDRPAGRGMKLTPSPVKQLALNHNLNVQQPVSLKDNQETIDYLKSLEADIMIVVAYGLLLPQAILEIPALGCLNIHGSLLPRWRGAAPIHRAILAGDRETGITIMKMDIGLDTGDMLISDKLEIKPNDTTQSIHDQLAELGGKLLIQALQSYDELTPIKQPLDGVTYAHKITKEEAKIDWNASTVAICRQIRAFNPAPGAYCERNGHLLKIWNASVIDDYTIMQRLNVLQYGQVWVEQKKIYVRCSDGVLSLKELQLSGHKRLNAEQFLQGQSIHLEQLK